MSISSRKASRRGSNLRKPANHVTHAGHLTLVLLALLIVVGGVVWARYPVGEALAARVSHQEVVPPATVGADSEPVVEEEERPIPEVLLGPFAHGLWYESLSEKKQGIYDELLVAYSEFSDYIQIDHCSQDELAEASTAVCGDHPELFWVDMSCEYEYTEGEDSVEVYPRYLMNQEEMVSTKQAIMDRTAECLARAREATSEYDQVRVCYDWIISNTDYCDQPREFMITGVILDGKAVCTGYARTLQYLLHEIDIECEYITGDAGEPHAWNLVYIDDTPVFVDAMWGDPVEELEDGSTVPGNTLAYDFFGVTSEEIARSHSIEWPGKTPVCDSHDYDYYRREGLFFETFDKEQLEALVDHASVSGETTVRFKLGTSEAYHDALAFIESDACFEVLPGNVEEYSWENQEDMFIVGLNW